MKKINEKIKSVALSLCAIIIGFGAVFTPVYKNNVSASAEEVSTYAYKYAYRIVITPDAWTPVDWDWENFRKATNGEVYDMEGYLKFGDVESERFIVHLKDSEYPYNSADTNFILMQTGYSSFNVNLLYPIRALFSEPVCGIEDWFVAGDSVEGVIYKGSFDFVFVDGGDVQRFTYNSDCNVYVNRWQVLVEDVEPEEPIEDNDGLLLSIYNWSYDFFFNDNLPAVMQPVAEELCVLLSLFMLVLLFTPVIAVIYLFIRFFGSFARW